MGSWAVNNREEEKVIQRVVSEKVQGLSKYNIINIPDIELRNMKNGHK